MTTTTELSARRNSQESKDKFLDVLQAKLAEINVVLRDRRNEKELRVAASFFLDRLKGESLRDILDAIDMHCRRSSFFPTLHDILEILPSVRTARPSHARLAIPQETTERHTPGIHILLARLAKNRATDDERQTAIRQFQAAYAKSQAAGESWPFSEPEVHDIDQIVTFLGNFLRSRRKCEAR